MKRRTFFGILAGAIAAPFLALLPKATGRTGAGPTPPPRTLYFFDGMWAPFVLPTTARHATRQYRAKYGGWILCRLQERARLEWTARPELRPGIDTIEVRREYEGSIARYDGRRCIFKAGRHATDPKFFDDPGIRVEGTDQHDRPVAEYWRRT